MTSETKRLSRGAGWIFSSRWINRLLAFASVAVLARILLPEDFGLVAIAASYVAIVEGLSEFDVNRALIQSRNEDRELYDSAWTLSSLRGVLAALVMIGLSYLITDPRMGQILWVLALAPLFTGVSNPRFVLFERDLEYSRVAVAAVISKLASFVLTLVVAVVYRSYWALVVGIVAGTFVNMFLTYALRPYRPRITVERAREILQFSGWMSLANMATTLSMRTDRIIVGRFLGVADAGLYYMTQRIGVLPTSELVSPLQRILFPSFSQIASDRVRLRRAVCESINAIGSLSLPAACGFALISSEFVSLVLGQRWLSIVPLVGVLVPYLGLRATLSMTQPCVMALGQTRLMFIVSAVYAAVHLPIFIAGTTIFGLAGAIWGIAIAGVFYTALNVWLLRTTLGISFLEILSQLRRPFVSTMVMVGVVMTVNNLGSPEIGSLAESWARLTIKVVVGATVFVATQGLLWRIEGKPAGVERRLLDVFSR